MLLRSVVLVSGQRYVDKHFVSERKRVVCYEISSKLEPKLIKSKIQRGKKQFNLRHTHKHTHSHTYTHVFLPLCEYLKWKKGLEKV